MITETETDMQKEEHSKSIEVRKKLNFYARFVLSLVVFGSFLLLLYLLFFQQVGDTYRDIVNILVGSFVAIQLRQLTTGSKIRMIQNIRNHRS